jgi:hypothetical protein
MLPYQANRTNPDCPCFFLISCLSYFTFLDFVARLPILLLGPTTTTTKGGFLVAGHVSIVRCCSAQRWSAPASGVFFRSDRLGVARGSESMCAEPIRNAGEQFRRPQSRSDLKITKTDPDARGGREAADWTIMDSSHVVMKPRRAHLHPRPTNLSVV